jgi:hypothetical protein
MCSEVAKSSLVSIAASLSQGNELVQFALREYLDASNSLISVR